MKILAINGSYRAERGHTGFLIERIFEGARAAGAECESVALARLDVRRCVACDRCQRKEPLHHCIHEGKDDVQALFEKMARADLILYATPVYVFGMSALLKTLLERFYSTGGASTLTVSEAGLFFHEVDHAICSKPFAVLACCDNLEDETPRNVVEFFRTFSRFLDAPLVGTLVRNGGLLAAYGRRPEAMPKLAEVYEAFRTAGRELVTRGRVRRATERRASQEIVPVPGFRFLKRLRFRPFKRAFLERAERIRRAAAEVPGPGL